MGLLSSQLDTSKSDYDLQLDTEQRRHMFLDRGSHTFDYYMLCLENSLNLQRILVGKMALRLDIRANTSKPIDCWTLYIDYVDHKDLVGKDLKAMYLKIS